jgi:hypothetical protein
MKYDILLSDLRKEARERILKQIERERESLLIPAKLGAKIVIGVTCEAQDFLYLKGE